MAAFVEMGVGDSLVIGKSIIRLERKGGQRARLAVDTSEDIEHIKAGDRPQPSAPRSPAPFLRRPQPD